MKLSISTKSVKWWNNCLWSMVTMVTHSQN